MGGSQAGPWEHPRSMWGKKQNDKKIITTLDLHKAPGRPQELCSLLRTFLFSRKSWFFPLNRVYETRGVLVVKHLFLIPPVSYSL